MSYSIVIDVYYPVATIQGVRKPLFSIPFGLLTVVTLGVTFAPSSSSADVISLLAGVFRNSNAGQLQEIEQIQVKNIQTMPILTANASPLAEKASSEITKELKTANSIVGGMALTNENSSVLEGDPSVQLVDTPNSDRISLYTVRNNDTLAQIAEMYGVTSNTILWANDLEKGAVLKPDQVLVILPISSIKYTVKKGDTIENVAKKFNGDAREIAQFNSLEIGSALAVGEEIMIPDANGALSAELQKKAEQDSKKKNTSSSNGAKNVKTAVSSVAGYFMRPIVGGVKTQGVHGNNGVDFASSYGAPILAAASGQVIISKSGGWGGGYGTYVVIKHSNGTQTLYAHMSQTLVSAGQTVAKGQQIGKMGNTGQSTGTHLHFEVRGGKNPF